MQNFFNENTKDVHILEELGEQINGGYAKTKWCGERECEDMLKEKFSATIRCMPFDQTSIGETFVCCGRLAHKVICFAMAY